MTETNIVQRWIDRRQKFDGNDEKVIKELKALLRRADPNTAHIIRLDLKFASAQYRLMRKCY